MAERRIIERFDLVSRQRAARMLGVSINTVTARILDGTLGAEHISECWFILRADVERSARAHATDAARVEATNEG